MMKTHRRSKNFLWSLQGLGAFVGTVGGATATALTVKLLYVAPDQGNLWLGVVISVAALAVSAGYLFRGLRNERLDIQGARDNS